MTIWKLTPVDLADPNWEASSHRGVAVVRAPDEESARAAAAEAFDVPVRFKPGAGVKAPPWLRPQLVTAKRLEDSPFEADGPTEVLDPSF